MTERDAFEIRFHAAVHGYVGRVSSDLDPVELAHRIAGARPRRWSPVAVLGRPAIAIPRAAWVPLLLAGVLAVTLGAMLIVGSQPKLKLPAVVVPLASPFACPAGSNPNAPGPVGQARPPFANSSPMTFDRRAGRLVLVAAPYGPVVEPETWTFDVCTNTWTRMRGIPLSSGAGVEQLAYDAAADLTFSVDAQSGQVWAYDLARDMWTAGGVGPGGIAPMFTWSERLWPQRLVSDPVSGDLLLAYQAGQAGGPDLWNYDVATDKWTAVSAEGFSAGVLVAYDASVDRLVSLDYRVAYEGPFPLVTTLTDLRHGGLATPGAVLPEISFVYLPSGNEITYDEAAGMVVILSHGWMIAYDATADRWTVVDTARAGEAVALPCSRCRDSETIVYDPVNRRLVVYGGSYYDPSRTKPVGSPTASGDPASSTGGLVQDDGVEAFDLATRTWTVLLEPTQVQPIPN